MAVSVATSYSPIDGKLARTLAVLATRPGRLLEAYRAGAGSLYVTPLKLFVATTALFLALLNFSSTTLYQYTWKAEPGQPVTVSYDARRDEVTVAGAVEESRWLQRKIDPAIDPAVTAALQKAMAGAPTAIEKASINYELAWNDTEARLSKRLSEWLPNVLWLLMPLYAVGLIPLFGRRRLFLEHVIFAMWAHAISFFLMMALAALNSRGANLTASLLVVPYLAYFTVAASRYYAVPPLSALWRGIVHLAAYILLVLLPVAFVINITVVDWDAWWAWAIA